MTAVAPQPVYEVRCTASGCKWRLSSNVASHLAYCWRAHAAWHRKQAA